MDLNPILEGYLQKYPLESYRNLAYRIIKNEPDFPFAHRTLRRKLANLKSRKKKQTAVPNEVTYKGRKSITSLSEAIKFFNIDTDVYEVSNFVCNAWDVTNKLGETFTNYQVKVKLDPKKEKVKTSEFYSRFEKSIKQVPLSKNLKGLGIGTIAIADLHSGSRVTGLAHTQDYSWKHMIQRLRSIAEYANSKNLKEVYLYVAGDMIETFTGLNHITSWQELEHDGHGANLLKITHRIFTDFFRSINNLKGFYMVAGNHDRTGIKREDDPKGEAASLLHYMLTLSFPELETGYDPLVVTRTVGNIRYIMTHDHNALSKDIGKMLFRYGLQDGYNIIFTGHWHQLKGKRIYREVQEYGFDEFNYRSIGLPPIFTGNFYSESLGYTSRAGFYFDMHMDGDIPDHTIKSLK